MLGQDELTPPFPPIDLSVADLPIDFAQNYAILAAEITGSY